MLHTIQFDDVIGVPHMRSLTPCARVGVRECAPCACRLKENKRRTVQQHEAYLLILTWASKLMSLRSNTYVLALLTLLSANSLLGNCHQCINFKNMLTYNKSPLTGKQLVLPEGDEEHSIPCQGPDAANYVILWAVDGAVIAEDELMGFKVGEEKAVADGIKERNITAADVHSTTLRCVVTDVLNATNTFPPQEYIVIIQGLQ